MGFLDLTGLARFKSKLDVLLSAEIGKAKTHYAICTTEAANPAKAVSSEGFELSTGAQIIVKFTTSNVASEPTLSVNSGEAIDIYYGGSAIPADYIEAGKSYLFTYNGTQFDLIGDAGKITVPPNTPAGKFLQTDSNGEAIWGNAASPATVASATEQWLEDNVSGGDTIAVDKSLTISGAAADSKVVGDALDEITSILEDDCGYDVDFDEATQTLYVTNSEGARVGIGTTIQAGISGLSMDIETEDEVNYLVLYDDNGVEICRTELIGGGGGGGGATAYVARLINGMSGLNLSFPSGKPCEIDYSFYEYYGQDQTSVNAAAKYYMRTATTEYTQIGSETISQGSNSVDITDYLNAGTNYLQIQVTGGESNITKTLTFTITVVDISLTSTFDDTQAYTGSISFMYRVTGRNISKTMKFYVDDVLYNSEDIGTSHNIQLTKTIDLSSYAHGAHKFECYFVTSEGAESPHLVYDIIYDKGLSTPIVASTFDIDEVAYGTLISVPYVVFTHGSDTTASVNLDIYQVVNGVKSQTAYAHSELENVPNETERLWNITQYPSSGTISLEISAGSSTKAFEVDIVENTGDRDINGVDTRLIAAYSASGRSNADANKSSMNASYTTVDSVTTTIPGTLTGFNFRSNGWVEDDDGYPVLRVSGGAEVDIDMPFFASQWTDADSHTVRLAGTPTAVGRTFELAFKTSGVTDETKPIMTLWDSTNSLGIKVFPSRAYLLSSLMNITQDSEGSILNRNTIPYVNYSSQNGKVRITFVLEEIGHYVETDDGNKNKQLVRVYVNGQLAKAITYADGIGGDDFTSSIAKPHFEAEACILDIYSMRFYDYALSDADVLKNYIADLPSIAERIAVYDKNAIVDDGDNIDFALAAKQYPCMVMTGELSPQKGTKKKIGVRLYKPDGTTEDGYYIEWDYMDKDGSGKYGNQNNVQGTSSQYYLKKNYKITFYTWDTATSAFKKAKVTIMPGMIPVSTICVKADYMSPDSANTGNANFWQSNTPEPTPPQVLDSRVQTSIKGYPILMFHCATDSSAPEFIGRYNLNNDKSNEEAFGLKTDGDSGNVTKCQKWEYKDNAQDICQFLTDRFMQPKTDENGSSYIAWEAALESCYPDQGDLEDEGLLPNLDYMQIMYSWLCQRANFIDASKTTGGGTYNGVTYNNDYDMKLAIFKREFQWHFNLPHTLHYFIANEVALLVDNLAKNMFMTCYDVTAENIVDTNGDAVTVGDLINASTGAVDISGIDWESGNGHSSFAVWYPTLYDLDSCLGADNNGYDKFAYYKETWDTYNNDKIVNGKDSLFWRQVYTAFYDELNTLYCTMRNTDGVMSPALYAKAMIDDLTQALPVVAVNKDEKFKYIDAYEGGYYDASANDGEGGWVYRDNYLYLVKGTMDSYHRDFITKRFAMLDGKYRSNNYLLDNFNFRVNAGNVQPEEIAFNVAPCQAMYLYSDWGNRGVYVGGKCLEGETIEMKPDEAGYWFNIVVAIYGASHIKSFGDLSPLKPSLLQDLGRCVNLTELILGSEANGYANSQLAAIPDIRNLVMLQKINVGNCTALSGALDLSNCDLIEEVYAKGSGISSVTLPNGGYLTKMHLPATITALNILNHTSMSEFTMTGYNNINRLHVENTPNIPTAEIVAARGTNLGRIRLVGVNWTLSDETALRVIANDAMKAKAIDVNGNPVDNTNTWPTITGTVTIERIQDSLLQKLNTVYPNLTINYTTLYHVVTFMNDGVLFGTADVDDGETAVAPGTPTRMATKQYFYSFNGWDATLANVTADKTVNATYSTSLQQYTLKFYDSDNAQTRQLLATVTGVSYGADYTYPLDPPVIAGAVFCGWQDGNGHTYPYVSQMPVDSTAVDSIGHPIDVELYPYLSPIEMPANTTAFSMLTPGQMQFCADAIANGSASGCSVVYYSDSHSYIITNLATNATVTIAQGDTRQWTLYDGSTITQQVAEFNRDFSDLNETKRIGITYAMRNLWNTRHNMNPSFKHAYNYKFGNETPIVNDNNDHSSATDALLTRTHQVTADEATAGKVVLTALGPTYLDKIIVTHSNNDKKTWYFGKEGFWGGADAATFTQSGSGAAVSCPWYKSDLDSDAQNTYYKIGKMLSAANVTPVNGSGSAGSYGWASEQLQWGFFINREFTFSDFGGLKIDTTGTDTLNTAAQNAFNGNGKSRVTFCKDWTNDWNNFTEMSEGTVIEIPVTAGDEVTVVCYGYSRNWGGWDNSSMKAWINSTLFPLFPYALASQIIPACKKCSVGNRSYAVTKSLNKVWLFSYSELANVTSHPYIDEVASWDTSAHASSAYPIFTDNASRIKYLDDGAGAVYSWWERDPHLYYSYSFMYVYTSGHAHGNHHANGTNGVCLGFCSGSAAA